MPKLSLGMVAPWRARQPCASASSGAARRPEHAARLGQQTRFFLQGVGPRRRALAAWAALARGAHGVRLADTSFCELVELRWLRLSRRVERGRPIPPIFDRSPTDEVRTTERRGVDAAATAGTALLSVDATAEAVT